MPKLITLRNKEYNSNASGLQDLNRIATGILSLQPEKIILKQN